MNHEEPKDFTLRLDERVPLTNVNRYQKAHQLVMSELRKRGIILAPVPIDHQGNVVRPFLPERLSDIPPADLLDLLGQMGAYLEYAEAELMRLDVEQDMWERTKTLYKSQLRQGQPAQNTKVTDRINNDPRYQEIDEKEFMAKDRYMIAKGVVEGANRAFFTVSRAITARGIELERLGREHNVSGKREGSISSTISRVPQVARKALSKGLFRE